MHRCIDSDACHQHGEERTPPKEVWEEIWVSLMCTFVQNITSFATLW